MRDSEVQRPRTSPNIYRKGQSGSSIREAGMRLHLRLAPLVPTFIPQGLFVSRHKVAVPKNEVPLATLVRLSSERDALTYNPMDIRCLDTMYGLMIIKTVDGPCDTRYRLFLSQTEYGINVRFLLRL